MRAELAELGKTQPKILEELVAYCRRRLLLNVMRTSPLFNQFDEATRLRLLERFQTITCSPGQAIISRGQPPTGLYVIASGSAQVQVVEPGAGVVTLAQLGPALGRVRHVILSGADSLVPRDSQTLPGVPVTEMPGFQHMDFYVGTPEQVRRSARAIAEAIGALPQAAD